jgi:hypothetical protein
MCGGCRRFLVNIRDSGDVQAKFTENEQKVHCSSASLVRFPLRNGNNKYKEAGNKRRF